MRAAVPQIVAAALRLAEGPCRALTGLGLVHKLSIDPGRLQCRAASSGPSMSLYCLPPRSPSPRRPAAGRGPQSSAAVRPGRGLRDRSKTRACRGRRWRRRRRRAPITGFDFARAWFATIGAAQRSTPLIVVARDDTRSTRRAAAVCTGPACGPLRFAVFLGGKDLTFLPWPLPFRAGRGRADDVAALLAAAAPKGETEARRVPADATSR